MATMEGMDAGAWCAGLPMARWSKCYPRDVMQLFGEGPREVNDKIISPIISKKKRNLKVLYSTLIFILLVVVISLMIVFIIQYKDNTTKLSKNTAITKNVNVVNTITIFTAGNRTTPSNTTEGGGKSKVDVAAVVDSLERSRWLSSAGKNAHYGPNVTKETSGAGGSSTGGIPNGTKQDKSDISVEVLGTNNETKLAIALTLNSHQDKGRDIEGGISSTAEFEEELNAGVGHQTTPSDRNTNASDFVHRTIRFNNETGRNGNVTLSGKDIHESETTQMNETEAENNSSRVARMEGQINTTLASNYTNKTRLNENGQARDNSSENKQSAFVHDNATVNNQTVLASENNQAASLGGNNSDHKTEDDQAVSSGCNSSSPDGDGNGSSVNKHFSSLFYSSLPIFNKIHDTISQW